MFSRFFAVFLSPGVFLYTQNKKILWLLVMFFHLVMFGYILLVFFHIEMRTWNYIFFNHSHSMPFIGHILPEWMFPLLLLFVAVYLCTRIGIMYVASHKKRSKRHHFGAIVKAFLLYLLLMLSVWLFGHHASSTIFLLKVQPTIMQELHQHELHNNQVVYFHGGNTVNYPVNTSIGNLYLVASHSPYDGDAESAALVRKTIFGADIIDYIIFDFQQEPYFLNGTQLFEEHETPTHLLRSSQNNYGRDVFWQNYAQKATMKDASRKQYLNDTYSHYKNHSIDWWNRHNTKGSNIGVICDEKKCWAGFNVEWWTKKNEFSPSSDWESLWQLAGSFELFGTHLEPTSLTFYPHSGEAVQILGETGVSFRNYGTTFATYNNGETYYTCDQETSAFKEWCRQKLYSVSVDKKDFPFIDPKTYQYLGEGYSKDSQHVYYYDEILVWANPATFHVYARYADAGDENNTRSRGKKQTQ